MKKIIYIFLAIIFLAIIAVVIILNFQNKIFPEINDKNCSSDSDCVIVATLDPSNPCCTTCGAEAISEQAEMKRNEWYAENCKSIECPIYDCYAEKLPKPRCTNNQCEVEWVERSR